MKSEEVFNLHDVLDQIILENATLKAKLALYVRAHGEITINGPVPEAAEQEIEVKRG